MRRSLIGIALLVALVAAGSASAAYPGKNGRLLFFRGNPQVTDMDSNPAEIWTANPDGSRQGRLTNANFESGGVGVIAAVWSPDGSTIAYATDCGTRYDPHCGVLRTMRADGHVKRTIDVPLDPSNHAVGGDRSPTWSPDGTRIAFERIWPTPDSIWTVGVDGKGAAQLIPQALKHPVWSPDGARIAFSSGTTIGVVNLDGSDERIVATNAYDYGPHPDWSPDGASIAFAQVRNKAVWVCIVPAAGGTVRCLTPGGEPAWSPDGKQVVYVHAQDIWTIHADGTHRRNVTHDKQWESDPDWQPR